MKKRCISMLLALFLVFSLVSPSITSAYAAQSTDPMSFRDGLAQPVFNIDRDIERFCVYVETDYDTDADGKLDLIKVLVQLPTAAMNGDYKAGVIYEARPYIAGEGSHPGSSGRCSEEDLYRTAGHRPIRGTATTAQVAANARPGEYNFYENLDWYDYFLVRGFAVVTAAGLGTLGSEGFETCGTDLEIDAFASVIEWLNGSPEAVAFTDRSSNVKVDADWSNGKVGMTGRSYSGTTQFGIAGTGVKGLETIVPVSGIASWYEYSNSQGYSMRGGRAYSDWLASYCASRVNEGGWNKGRYGAYLDSIADDESSLNGNYGPHYERRDYTLNPHINCSALIVHGLNDNNVRTKNYQLMYDAFKNAGQNVKLLLHQDGHVTPAYGANKTEQFINGEAYQQVLNRWFSHYLFGVQNGAENMAAVTAQNNYNGSKWDLYDSYDSTKTVAMNSKTMKVGQNMTIMGTVPVTVKAAPGTTGGGNCLHVRLVDTAPSPFNAFSMSGSYQSDYHRSTGRYFEVGGGAQNYKIVELKGRSTKSKVIAEGWMDLANPHAGMASSSAKRENVRSGQQYNYTVYLQANVYEVAPGHTLKLEVSADNGRIYSYSAALPVYEKQAPVVEYTFNVEPSQFGSVASSVSSGSKVAPGTKVTVTAVPNEGYQFKNWVVNGKTVTGEMTRDFVIDGNTTIKAEFEPIPVVKYTVSYTAENGTVSGIDNGAQVEEGTQVTLTAKANEGYEFAGWYVDGQKVSSNAQYAFTVNADVNVEARFTKIVKYTVNYTAKNGTVTGIANGTQVLPGTEVTLTAQANEGYEFAGWYVDGRKVADGAKYTFTANADVNVEARFTRIEVKPELFEVTYSAIGHGTVTGSVASGSMVESGTRVQLTAVPEEGYEFAGWLLNGKDVGGKAESTFIIKTNVNFEARFTEVKPEPVQQFKVEYTGIANGTVTADVASGAMVDAGSQITVTAHPAQGYQFKTWIVNDQVVVSTTTQTFTIHENTTIKAQFELIPVVKYTVNYTAVNGTVSGIENGSRVEEGTQVTLTARANEGYEFAGWYVDGRKVADSAQYTFTVNGNVNVEARFTEIVKYAVNYTAKNGTVTGIANGAKVLPGTQVTLTAQANEGYEFAGWYVDGRKVSSNAQYTFTVSGDVNVEARFTEVQPVVQYTVRYGAGAHGGVKGNIASGSRVEPGTTLDLKAYGHFGYKFKCWVVNGKTVSGKSHKTFTINGDTTIQAQFTKGWEIPDWIFGGWF